MLDLGSDTPLVAERVYHLPVTVAPELVSYWTFRRAAGFDRTIETHAGVVHLQMQSSAFWRAVIMTPLGERIRPHEPTVVESKRAVQ